MTGVAQGFLVSWGMLLNGLRTIALRWPAVWVLRLQNKQHLGNDCRRDSGQPAAGIRRGPGKPQTTPWCLPGHTAAMRFPPRSAQRINLRFVCNNRKAKAGSGFPGSHIPASGC